MDTVQLIVECNMDEERERLICAVGKIKYRLPMINSYVIEVSRQQADSLSNMRAIKSIYQNTHITAQMNSVRQEIGAHNVLDSNLTGLGVSIAVLDTGVAPVDDLTKPENRIIAFKDIINKKKHHMMTMAMVPM